MSVVSKLRVSLHALCFCSVAVCVGLNWTALQLIAWTGMTLNNARTMNLTSAMNKAVEGQGTCVICRLLDQQQKAESESSLLQLHSAIELKAVIKDDRVVLGAKRKIMARLEAHIEPTGFLAPLLLPPPQRSV